MHATSLRKRGGGAVKVSLDETAAVTASRAAELLAVDEALEKLTAMDARKGRIVELRFFGGLSLEETAEVMGISSPTVQREWRAAKAWLHRMLTDERAMKPERWQQVDQLFQAALEREPEERAAFISEACGGDDSLRREVEALLAADGQAGSLIEAPAYAMAAPLIAGDDAQLLVGKSISHYQIISLVGKGGMGEVYRARDTKLDRTVALKILPEEMSADTERMRRFSPRGESGLGAQPPECRSHL